MIDFPQAFVENSKSQAKKSFSKIIGKSSKQQSEQQPNLSRQGSKNNKGSKAAAPSTSARDANVMGRRRSSRLSNASSSSSSSSSLDEDEVVLDTKSLPSSQEGLFKGVEVPAEAARGAQHDDDDVESMSEEEERCLSNGVFTFCTFNRYICILFYQCASQAAAAGSDRL